MQGSSDQSPSRLHNKFTTQGKSQHSLNPLYNGVSKLDGISNGTARLLGKERVMHLVLYYALK